MAFSTIFNPGSGPQRGQAILPPTLDDEDDDATATAEDTAAPPETVSAPPLVSPFRRPTTYQSGSAAPAAPALPETPPPADPLSTLKAIHQGATDRLAVVDNAVAGLSPQHDEDGRPTNAAARDATVAQQWQDAGPGSPPPPPEVVTATQATANRAKLLQPLLTQQQHLTGLVGAPGQPGPLSLAVTAQQAHDEAATHQQQADNYGKIVQGRTAYLQSKGLPVDADPIIAQASEKAAAAGENAGAAQARRDGVLQQAADGGHDLSGHVPHLVTPPTAPKPYTVDADRKLSFDSQNATQAVNQAVQDGVIDPASAKGTLDLAQKADQQRAELEKLAGGSQKLKAVLAGVAPGLGFVGAGTAAAAVGNAGPNEVISALTGPLAPLTEGALSTAEFLIGGILGARGAKALQGKLGEYNETVRSLKRRRHAPSGIRGRGRACTHGAGRNYFCPQPHQAGG